VEIKVEGPGELPSYATDGSAGADLRALADAVLEPGQRAAVPTGVRLQIPAGHVGLIWPRSGLAVRHGIDTMAGVIDSDYRGEVAVLLLNWGREPYTIRRGDRIAQLVLAPVARARIEIAEALTATARGEGGFGHTGR